MNKILMYHSIGIKGSDEVGADLYSVPVDKFRKQMAYVEKVTRSVRSEAEPPRRGQGQCGAKRSLPEGDQISITFDDGLVDSYTDVFPALKELNLKAHFFIMPPKLGTSGYMNWDQVKELKNSGMEIGSHGMTHRILIGLSDEELEDEISESKKLIEKILGVQVDNFSVPRGFCNKKIIEMAKTAGYKAVFTSRSQENDGYKFGRIPVKGSWDLGYFKRVLEQGLPLKDRARDLIIDLSKNTLGARNYDRLRTVLLKK